MLDGAEPNPSDDSDGDGLINPLDPDSDNDGILDGTELGVTTANAATDTSKNHFLRTPIPGPRPTRSCATRTMRRQRRLGRHLSQR